MSYFGIPIRNGLPIGLGTVAPLGTNNSAFSPASFFANGEQGWWYDPSNFATLFQDSAGTTPVTAVEQPVGLQLDLSKGLVLGPELVTNGTFTTDTAGWTAQNAASLASVNSELQITSTGTNFPLAITSGAGISTVVGRTYVVTAVARRGTSVNPARVQISGITGVSTTSTTNSAIKFYFTATSTNHFVELLIAGSASAGDTAFFDNVSVKSLAGNHRFQSTSANRPVVSARVNLLTKTEQFDDAAWSKENITITANTAVAPNGTTTADTFRCVTLGLDCLVRQNFTSNFALTASCYFKYIDNAWVAFSNGLYFCYFNIQTGTLGTVGNGSATITDVGNGWYRCSWNQTDTSATSVLRIRMAGANNSSTTTPANATVFVWGADDRATNQGVDLPAYQRVNTSTDYDSTGFPVYIKPNGSNQFMQTNSINFTATDKMTVWQGVRKLSDASQSVVAELSASIAANNGTFLLTAPNSAAANYNFASKGTTQVDNIVTTYTSPITNVLVGIGDISGSINSVKVNGGAATTVTSSQGTGNYGTYPAYFYARAGTSLYFSGNDYGSIARGAASTAAQITNGETYMAAKTGVTLLVETFDFITTDAGDQIVTDDGDSVITDIFYV